MRAECIECIEILVHYIHFNYILLGLVKAIEHLNSCNLRPGDGCSPDCKVEALYESGPDTV